MKCDECTHEIEPGQHVQRAANGLTYCWACAHKKRPQKWARVGYVHITCDGTGEREGSVCRACAGTGIEVPA